MPRLKRRFSEEGPGSLTPVSTGYLCWFGDVVTVGIAGSSHYFCGCDRGRRKCAIDGDGQACGNSGGEVFGGFTSAAYWRSVDRAVRALHLTNSPANLNHRCATLCGARNAAVITPRLTVNPQRNRSHAILVGTFATSHRPWYRTSIESNRWYGAEIAENRVRIN